MYDCIAVKRLEDLFAGKMSEVFKGNVMENDGEEGSEELALME